ncbi:MAG: hypothetical protein GXX90_07360, partial [Microbacteriaceae bacterium]|nr:hypothetical protein [Microbacteriaceae bacterium]
LRDGVPRVAAKAITGDLQSVSPLLGMLVAKWIVDGERLVVDGAPVELAPADDAERYVLVSGYGVGGSFQSYVVRG